jgi:hypothetical protein
LAEKGEIINKSGRIVEKSGKTNAETGEILDKKGKIKLLEVNFLMIAVFFMGVIMSSAKFVV